MAIKSKNSDWTILAVVMLVGGHVVETVPAEFVSALWTNHVTTTSHLRNVQVAVRTRLGSCYFY